VAAPGTLAKHYSPNARVELVARADVANRRAAFVRDGMTVAVLDAPIDVDEYARVLYARLREADAPGIDVILAAMPEEDAALGSAVRDRLRRAAAG
jgi:L-threonylcarbamoyladenylate synthase